MGEAAKSLVLIVDDRAANRYAVDRILRKAGYATMEAECGQDALQKAVADNPDLIILDVNLPDMLGYDVCRRLKTNLATVSIPVLQLSASFLSGESKVQALDSGADAYLTQPLEANVLIATVQSLLRMKEAEALLRLSSKQWQVTFDALSEGIALLDSNDKVLRCNRALTGLLNSSFTALVGHNARELLREHLNVEMNVAGTGATRQRQESQNGTRWYAITAEPLFDAGTLKGHILIVRDISDHKAAEQALRETERLASTGKLANSIAHEINNPLEAVTNLLYLLGRSSLAPEQREFVEIASKELERVARITKQTLAFGRDTQGPVELSLTELIDGLLVLYRSQFAEKRITVVQRYESDAPTRGLPGELRQVFTNLIFNALEAMEPERTLTIHIRRSYDWEQSGRAGMRVSIFDQGCGMPRSVMAQIFEPFFTTKQLKGTGLGLWLAASTIAKHGGRISVRSRTGAGSGTCFSVFLPETDERANMANDAVA